MTKESRELYSLLKGIENHPEEELRYRVLADWLDEHDEPELALGYRKFSVKKHMAEKRLREYANRWANGDYEGMIQGMLEGHYCFSSDDGPEEARYNKEVWEDIMLVTGKEINIEEHIENSSFRCAC